MTSQHQLTTARGRRHFSEENRRMAEIELLAKCDDNPSAGSTIRARARAMQEQKLLDRVPRSLRGGPR